MAATMHRIRPWEQPPDVYLRGRRGRVIRFRTGRRSMRIRRSGVIRGTLIACGVVGWLAGTVGLFVGFRNPWVLTVLFLATGVAIFAAGPGEAAMPPEEPAERR